MARHLSALKRARQNEKRRLRNQSRKTRVKNVVRQVRSAVAQKNTEEAQAAEKLAAAANIMSVYPAAMHLRFLQTLSGVSAEKNSTVIFPLPIDLLTKLFQMKEKE